MTKLLVASWIAVLCTIGACLSAPADVTDDVTDVSDVSDVATVDTAERGGPIVCITYPCCGDGTCEPGESCRSCPSDCGCPRGQICHGSEQDAGRDAVCVPDGGDPVR